MKENKKLFSIVIPAMNEEEVLPLTLTRLTEVTKSLQNQYQVELIFIDDGSKDMTLEILKKWSKDNPNLKVISMSRNFGHQIAITAGAQSGRRPHANSRREEHARAQYSGRRSAVPGAARLARAGSLPACVL